MAELSDEAIRAILLKDVSAKSVLVDPEEAESTITAYLKDGWELFNNVELNGRLKITFRKSKPAK